MILLDTNVLSSLMQQRPEPQVIEWLDAQPNVSIWTTSVSIFEIRLGLQTMPEGRRPSDLSDVFNRMLEKIIELRIAPFDSAAAHRTADLVALRKLRGRTGELRDSMIGGIALACKAQLATRNTRHFDDLPIHLINPWNN